MNYGSIVSDEYYSGSGSSGLKSGILTTLEDVAAPSTEAIKKKVEPTNGVLVSAFIITSTTMGAGIVSFPNGFLNAGIVSAFSLLFGSLIYSVLCTRMYFWALNGLSDEEKAKLESFEDAVEIYFGFTKLSGKINRKIAELIMFLAMSAPCVIYLGIIGDSMTPVFKLSSTESIFSSRTFVILLFSCVIIYPFCLLRRLGMLKYTSYVAIITIWYIVFLVPIIAFLGMTSLGKKGSGIPSVPADGFGDHVFINTSLFGGIAPNIFMTLPTFSFSFGCQIVCTQVFSELKNRKMWKFDCIALIAYSIVTVGYVFVGFFGFMSFGRDTAPDILSNYGSSGVLSIPIWTGRLCMGLHTTCVYPTIQMVQRASLNSVFFGGQNTNSINHVATTTIIFVGNLLIALLVPDITLIFGFMVSILIVIVCYVYPCLFFIIFVFRKVKKWRWRIPALIVPVLCLLYSFIMMVTGPLTSIFKMRAEADSVK